MSSSGQPFDYVITVCDRARQSCPVFPGPYNSLHWGLDDPAEVEGTDAEKLAAFQRTYLELVQRIRPFVEVALRGSRTEPPSRHRRLKELPLGPALVAEALGTFILVFAGCGAIAVGTLPASGVAAAFGLAIMVSIYALGHVAVPISTRP